jgi:hypothetical protein
MYKLHFGGMQQPFVILIATNTFVSLEPSDPDNTDYSNFKKQIMFDKTQLQDVDGNVMTAEAAKEFVRGLL